MEKLLWLDMEMTGLEVSQDRPLEVACIATNSVFDIVSQNQWVVHQSDITLAGMNEWCTKHHGASGLTQDVIHKGVPEMTVDEELCQWVNGVWGEGAQTIVLAGNSIHQDRLFVNKYFPKFAQKLHYRMLDVTAYKIYFETHLNIFFEKKNNHRAYNDVLDSLQEFLFYISFIKGNK